LSVCRIVGYLYYTYSENLNWAAQNIKPGHMWPEGCRLDIADIDDAQPSLGYILSTKLFLHFLLFSIICISVTGGIMMNRKQL